MKSFYKFISTFEFSLRFTAVISIYRPHTLFNWVFQFSTASAGVGQRGGGSVFLFMGIYILPFSTARAGVGQGGWVSFSIMGIYFTIFSAMKSMNDTIAHHLRMKRNNFCAIFRITRNLRFAHDCAKSKLRKFFCANSKIAQKSTFFAKIKSLRETKV